MARAPRPKRLFNFCASGSAAISCPAQSSFAPRCRDRSLAKCYAGCWWRVRKSREVIRADCRLMSTTFLVACLRPLVLARRDLDLAERVAIGRLCCERQARERGVAVPADHNMIAAGRCFQAQRWAIHIEHVFIRLPLVGWRARWLAILLAAHDP